MTTDSRDDDAQDDEALADESGSGREDPAPFDGVQKKKKRKKKRKVLASARGAALAPRGSASASAPRTGGKGSLGAAVFAAFALIVGAGLGWFLRDYRSKSDVSASQDPAMSASAAAAASVGGPCAAWSQTICEQAGPQSEGCGQAKGAADLLPATACSQALAEVPATLEKLKGARSVCEELVTKLCDAIGKETQTCQMVKEKTAGFPPARCKEMLQNSEAIVAELRGMEQKNQPLAAEEVAKQRAGAGPSFGPSDAKVAIVEYSDFECPFCSQGAQTVTKLKERYGEVVRFVFRQFPLQMHPNAQLAAEASLAAHAQGKFWPYHDLMFANQRALDRKSLEEYAKKVGLDMGKFKKALDDHSHADAVKADMKLGEGMGVSGTPTMIVGTKRVANPTDFAAVSAMVDAELTAAGVAVPAAK